MTDIFTTLAEIQHQMRAPKNKRNEFGGYSYRNAEGILAAFKSLGIEGAALTCSDTIQEVAGQIFVTATARLDIGDQCVTAQGHAMHPLQKKGMDASQITGSASSYARKYALCGLFAIEDETQDPDSRDNRAETGQTKPPYNPKPFIQKIVAAMTGRELLEAINAKGCDNNHPDIAAARVEKLAQIVKGAQSIEAIDAMKKHFAPDWPSVKEAADARKAELTPAPADDLGGDEIPH